MKKGSDILIAKARSRIDINIALLSICFLLFTLIITIKPSILSDNILLASELTLTIPLLITSSLAKTKSIDSAKKDTWTKFGSATFTIAYGMLINVMGIFLTSFVNIKISLLFFTVNILMALLYSTVELIGNKEKLRERFYKDCSFIIILILGGILPSLGAY